MITQQQALEALEALKHAGPDGWGPIEHFTTLRQYIEQGAQPGADMVLVPRALWQGALKLASTLSAAPQPQQEQSK